MNPPPEGRNNSPLPPGEGARRAGEGLADQDEASSSSQPTRTRTHVRLDPQLLQFVRVLREQQSDPERLLWYVLRGRRLAGAKFRRQYLIDPYVVDFYCHEVRLAIELDGGQHNAPEKRNSDEKRTHLLAQRGIRVLRFWNDEVLKETEGVLEAIAHAIEKARGQE